MGVGVSWKERGGGGESKSEKERRWLGKGEGIQSLS